jgi:flagellar protein FliS
MFSSPLQAGNRKPFAAMYRDVGVTSIIDGASPHKLVSLLYQQLGIEIARARGALARRDVLEKCTAVNKAVRIVQEGRRRQPRRQPARSLRLHGAAPDARQPPRR